MHKHWTLTCKRDVLHTPAKSWHKIIVVLYNLFVCFLYSEIRNEITQLKDKASEARGVMRDLQSKRNQQQHLESTKHERLAKLTLQHQSKMKNLQEAINRLKMYVILQGIDRSISTKHERLAKLTLQHQSKMKNLQEAINKLKMYVILQGIDRSIFTQHERLAKLTLQHQSKLKNLQEAINRLKMYVIFTGHR